MKQKEVRSLLLKAEWFEYDKINGLRLDGYYTPAELKAFIWAMENNEDWLEKQSSCEEK